MRQLSTGMLNREYAQQIAAKRVSSSKNHKVVDTVILILFILFNAGAAPITANPFFVVASFLFCVVVFINRKKEVDVFLYLFLSAWIVINVISSFVNKIEHVEIVTYIGVTLRMLMPYFMIKAIGVRFFDKLFKFLYPLVILSLPLYVLEQITPSLFENIAPIFSFMTGKEQVASNGFYSFVFMHSGWESDDFRNSGFMWEPGAYAFVLIFFLYYYWCRVGVIINKKVIIILIALITTLSTAGFIALFFAVLYYITTNGYFKKNTLLMPVFCIIFFVAAIQFYQKSEFMSDKIDDYVSRGTDTYDWEFGSQKLIRMSRLGIFTVSLEDVVLHPIGNGIKFSDSIIEKYGIVAGPSSLAEILRQWGLVGIIFLYIGLCKFSRFFKTNKFGVVMFCLSMSCMLFSNPFTFKYLIYGIFFYAMIYSKKMILKKRNNNAH